MSWQRSSATRLWLGMLGRNCGETAPRREVGLELRHQDGGPLGAQLMLGCFAGLEEKLLESGVERLSRIGYQVRRARDDRPLRVGLIGYHVAHGLEALVVAAGHNQAGDARRGAPALGATDRREAEPRSRSLDGHRASVHGLGGRGRGGSIARSTVAAPATTHVRQAQPRGPRPHVDRCPTDGRAAARAQASWPVLACGSRAAPEALDRLPTRSSSLQRRAGGGRRSALAVAFMCRYGMRVKPAPRRGWSTRSRSAR